MSQFRRIGLMGKPNHPEVKSSFHALIPFLQSLKIDLVVEQSCESLVEHFKLPSALSEDLGSRCDLVIVVGGDGSLLKAARLLVDSGTPVIGVNRGRKGFLTDVSPQSLTQELEPILTGAFVEEKRFLIHATVQRNDTIIESHIALNDVVLYSGHVARMIEFETFINQTFVSRQRADGLIVATPTGSTAYALSGGGPIVHPEVDAMVIVPMHPHTLSSRTIVVDANAQITLHVVGDNQIKPRISWDGQIHRDVLPDDVVQLRKHEKQLRLLHPKNYDYYQTLRSKLGWNIHQ